MVVEGYEVSSEIETGAVEWVRGCRGHHGDFVAGDLIAWLHRSGVPLYAVQGLPSTWGLAYRIAGRIIQRERELGSISSASGAWHRSAKVADGLPALLALHREGDLR